MRLKDGGNNMNKYMVKWKSILVSALCILPIALIGGITTSLYMLQHSDPELIKTAIAQLGSLEALVAIATMQSVVYAMVAWIVGYFLVERLGLLKSFEFELTVLKKSCSGYFDTRCSFCIGLFYFRKHDSRGCTGL